MSMTKEEQHAGWMTFLVKSNAGRVQQILTEHYCEAAGRFQTNPSADNWNRLQSAMALHQWAQKHARQDQLARIASQNSTDASIVIQCQQEQVEDWKAMG